MGFSGFTPYLSNILAINPLGSSLFLSLKGFIEGGLMTTFGRLKLGTTYFSEVNTVVSYLAMYGSKKFHTAMFGVDVSMWHRQIHRLLLFGM